MCVAGVRGRVSSLHSVSSLLNSSRVGVLLMSECMALLSLRAQGCMLLVSEGVFPLFRVSPLSLIAQGWVFVTGVRRRGFTLLER